MKIWTLTTENVAGENELATSVYRSEEAALFALRGVLDPDGDHAGTTDEQFAQWIAENSDAQFQIEQHTIASVDPADMEEAQ